MKKKGEKKRLIFSACSEMPTNGVKQLTIVFLKFLLLKNYFILLWNYMLVHITIYKSPLSLIMKMTHAKCLMNINTLNKKKKEKEVNFKSNWIQFLIFSIIFFVQKNVIY